MSEYDFYGRLNDYYRPYYEPRLFTYEEILQMVEASWEGVTLEDEPLAEDNPPETPPNSSPE